MYPFIRSILFQLDAERAHHLTLRWLSMFPSTAGWLNSSPQPAAMLKQRLFGLDFPHPVGLAAGLDKDGIAVDGLLAAGFSFVEVGTVTPRPQPGNPKPRLFRLRADEALINRMGFNNHGVTALQQNLLKRRRQGIVGVNLGKNKMTPNEQALADYLEGMDVIFPLADYIVINVSSPNTPGLRDLQAASQLVPLIEAVCKRRDELAAGNANMPDQSGLAYKSALGPGNAPDHRPAVLVKLAPDLSDDALVALASDLPATGMDGFIATNTTLSREGLASPAALTAETGGLSGRPLFARSTDVVSLLYRTTGGKLPIIASGGIFSADDAYRKIRAGASLIELYTGFIYRGPALIADIQRGLVDLLARDGFTSIQDAIGADA